MIILNKVNVELFPVVYADLTKICPWRRKQIRISGEYNSATGMFDNILRVDNFECVDKHTEEKVVEAWMLALGDKVNGNTHQAGPSSK